MRKFTIICSLVFVLAMWAEWVMFSNPSKGVVLDMEYQRATDAFKLRVLTSEGTYMDIKLPSKAWRDWLQPRLIQDGTSRH